MRKLFKFLPFIFSLFILISCGVDIKKPKTLKSEESLTGPTCACDSSYSPVCGSNNVDYENSCIASCFSATVSKQGHCSCSSTRMVCGDDGNSYNECVAQDMLTEGTLNKIVKFSDCSSTSL